MKKLYIKALSILMFLVISVCSLPYPTTAITTEPVIPPAEEPQQPVVQSFDFVLPNESYVESEPIFEMISRREESIKHFLMPDGTVRAIVYPESIHRLDEDGAWQPYRNQLSLQGEGQNAFYVTEDSRLHFAKQAIGGEALLSLQDLEYGISLYPASTQLPTQITASDAVVLSPPTSAPSKAQWETIDEAIDSAYSMASVTYANIYPKTDIEYTVRGSTIKENIIVKEPLPSYSYGFILTLNGLEAVLEANGAVSLHDEEGITRYVLPAPYMYDAANSYSRDVEYTLQRIKAGIYAITVTANAEWVNAEERVFPVTIDPTIKVNSGITDTFVNGADANGNYGAWETVWVDGTYTGLVKFPLPTLPAGATVVLAHLYMYYYYYSGVSGARTLGIYQMNAPWGENTVTYNTLYNQYGATLGSAASPMITVTATASSTHRKLNISVKAAVQAWYNGTANNGIAIKHVSDTLTSTEGYRSTIFESSEAATSTPSYVEIRYSEPRISSGLYRLKNVATGQYLTVENGATTAGTALIRSENAPTVNGAPNRNQLFKITYYTSTVSGQEINYYTLRSMTNSALAVGGPYLTEGNVTLQEKNVSDTVAPPLTQCWGIMKNGQNYVLKNGSDFDESYLTAPATSSTSTAITTSATLTENSYWVLEPYTGEAIHGVDLPYYPKTILQGETVSYANIMYSSVIGTNGPVLYSVAEYGGAPTTKATIDAAGNLTAVSAGTVAVQWTYAGSPWIWSILVDIGLEDGVVYTLRHTGSDTLMKTATVNSGSVVNAAAYNYDNVTSMWKPEYAGNGYYKLRNDVTGHYLIAPNNNTNGSVLTVGSDSGDRSLFKVTRIPTGTYRLQSKNQHERTTDAPLYLAVVNGNVVQSSTAANAWDIKPLKMNLTVQYDAAFVERHGAANYRALLTDIFLTEDADGVSIESVLKERFGIKLVFTIAETAYFSYPYQHDCYLIDSLGEACYNHWGSPMMKNCDDPSNALLTQAERTADCEAGLHHKNANQMMAQMPGTALESSQNFNMLFTGFITCSMYNGNCVEEVVQGWATVGLNKAIINSQWNEYDPRRIISYHELLHLLWAPDHGESGDPNCVYGANCFGFDYDEENQKDYFHSNLATCATCTATIQAHKLRLYYHQ